MPFNTLQLLVWCFYECNLHQSEYVNASHCLMVIVVWHPSAFGDHECDQFMVHQPLETNGSFTRLGSNACCGWGPPWEWQYLLDLLHLKMLVSSVLCHFCGLFSSPHCFSPLLSRPFHQRSCVHWLQPRAASSWVFSSVFGALRSFLQTSL